MLGFGQLANESFDPLGAPSSGKIYQRLMYDPIIGMNQAGDALAEENGIASSWEVSDAGDSITFAIREDATFSNGDAVTAEDVAFTLGRLAETGLVSPYAGLINGMIASVTVDSPTAVTVDLVNPNAFTFLQALGTLGGGLEGLVVPKTYFESVGAEQFNLEPIGSGPYILAELSPGDNMTFEARPEPHFAVGTPAYERVIIRLIPEETTRVAGLQTGELDFIDASRDASANLKAEGFDTFTREGKDVMMLYVPIPENAGEVLNDPLVREALSIAINREEIVAALFQGLAEPTGNFNPSAAVGYEPLAPDEFDPDRAKELLEEAGYSDLAITFQAFTFPGWPEDEQVANAIAGYWSDIGVTANIVFRDYATYRSEVIDRTIEPSIALHPLPGSSFPLPIMSALLGCGAPMEVGCDAGLDAAIATMRNSATEAEFAAAVAAAEELAHDSRYMMGLLQAGAVFVGSDKVPASYSPGTGFVDPNIPGLIWGQ